MQKNFDLTHFYFNFLLFSNFFESTLGNLTNTYNFEIFLTQKKDFLFKTILKETKKSQGQHTTKGRFEIL